MNIKWDADKYTENFSFVHQYGNDVMGLLALDKNMTVLDLGCGNGALTKRLADLGVRAIGLDASVDLLEVARQQFPDLEFMEADATDFELDEKMDAVFSNAVFHWIGEDRQGEMMQCVHKALKSGGQFVFEFGGEGNNRRIHSALREVFEERGLIYTAPFYFPSIGQYSAMLERAGFQVRFMTLFDRMTKLKGENGLEDWIRMFVKKPFENILAADADAMIREAVERLEGDLLADGVWYADYVRIRGKAIKP